VGASPGLRVRLKGPPGNINGVGAAIRPRFDQHWGPMQEIHAGSGYWSEDSVVQVIAAPERPIAIQVRWPGGSVGEFKVPSAAREILIDQTGTLVSK